LRVKILSSWQCRFFQSASPALREFAQQSVLGGRQHFAVPALRFGGWPLVIELVGTTFHAAQGANIT